MSRSLARPLSVTLLLATTVMVAREASAQGYRATVTVSARVAEVTQAPDVGLLAPRIESTADADDRLTSDAATPRAAPERTMRAPTFASVARPSVATSEPQASVAAPSRERYRVYVVLADTTRGGSVMVRNARGERARLVAGAPIVVADNLSAAEAVRAPLWIRATGGASGAAVQLRYVVMPMAALAN